MAERDEEQARRKNAVVAALSLHWGEVNRLLFRGVMRPPTMALAPLESMLGRWIAGPRLMEFSEAFVATAPWGEVFEVLKHEMAHQFVSEVLCVKDETAHGAAFQKVCADRGIDARAAGRPEEPAAEHEQRLVDRVRRLLSLAESPNLHEAEAAARMARRLIVKHNLEQEALHQTSDYTWRHLGTPSRRVGSHVKQLADAAAASRASSAAACWARCAALRLGRVPGRPAASPPDACSRSTNCSHRVRKVPSSTPPPPTEACPRYV
jgi:hypothetical protein